MISLYLLIQRRQSLSKRVNHANNMKITITTTIEISEENLPLIPVVINDNGGKPETETQEEAIIRITEDHARRSIISLIAPSIPAYFGKAQAEFAQQKLEQLEAKVKTTTTIE